MDEFNDLNNPSPAQQREAHTIMAGVAVVVLVTIAVAIIGFFFINRPDQMVEGQADATSVTISGKLPGRVVDFYVREGDMVHAGDTLVHIHSSVAEAQLMKAEAMETAARAQNRKVDAGTRTQIVQGAKDLMDQAAAGVEITRKTYERMDNLWREGVVSEQKRDEASAAYKAAVAQHDAAKSQYSLALAGAQSEDKVSAAAMVNVARGSVREVESVLEDQYLLAPCDGQVDEIYPEPGELVSLGAPIMSLLKTQDKWVVFNVREEMLNDLPLGAEIEIMIPALDKKRCKARVFYSRDMGTYATWRSTKTTGQWDSRTFCIKARPLDSIPELRPGMTIVLTDPVSKQ